MPHQPTELEGASTYIWQRKDSGQQGRGSAAKRGRFESSAHRLNENDTPRMPKISQPEGGTCCLLNTTQQKENGVALGNSFLGEHGERLTG